MALMSDGFERYKNNYTAADSNEVVWPMRGGICIDAVKIRDRPLPDHS